MAKKYIDFQQRITSAKMKTLVWDVMTAGMYPILLGQVRWYSQWRKYCFYPVGNSIYDDNCLTDIAKFCTDETSKHRVTNSKEKAEVQLSDDAYTT